MFKNISDGMEENKDKTSKEKFRKDNLMQN